MYNQTIDVVWVDEIYFYYYTNTAILLILCSDSEWCAKRRCMLVGCWKRVSKYSDSNNTRFRFFSNIWSPGWFSFFICLPDFNRAQTILLLSPSFYFSTLNCIFYFTNSQVLKISIWHKPYWFKLCFRLYHYETDHTAFGKRDYFSFLAFLLFLIFIVFIFFLNFHQLSFLILCV